MEKSLMSYFIRIQGKSFGPINLNEILQLKKHGKLKQFHEVSNDQGEWRPASDYPELYPSTAEIRPSAAAVYVAQPLSAPPSGAQYQHDPGPASRSYQEFYLASLFTAVGILIHFLVLHLQFYSGMPNLGSSGGSRVIFAVLTILGLLLEFALLITGAAFFTRSAREIQSVGFGASALILFVVSLIIFLAASILFANATTIDSYRIGMLITGFASGVYYSGFITLTFLFHRAFISLGRDGHGYSVHLLGFALIGILFASIIAATVLFMVKPDGETDIFIMALVMALETLGLLQLLLVWFLFEALSLRFFLGKTLRGQ